MDLQSTNNYYYYKKADITILSEYFILFLIL